jgi:hypothetical protein
MNKNRFEHLSTDESDNYDGRPVSSVNSVNQSTKVDKWDRFSDTKSKQIIGRTDYDQDWDYNRKEKRTPYPDYKKNRNYDYDEKKVKENYKKMRCLNIINSGSCTYGNKCLYAHSLEEQKVDGVRKMALDVILKRTDLSDIDITANKKLYAHLKCMSNMCVKCKEDRCTGGYNCKHGACNLGCVVCLEDMNKGTCKGECGKIHLTNRGLIPYGVRITKPAYGKSDRIKPVVIDDNFFKHLNVGVSETQEEQIVDSNESNQTDESNESIEIEKSTTVTKEVNTDTLTKPVNREKRNIIDIFMKNDDSSKQTAKNVDPLLSLLNHDFLLESALARQETEASANNELTNLLSVADTSSDSISLSDSADESEDITDILLMNNDTTKLEKSIFGNLLY